jgi:dTMP kinase
MTAMQKPQFFGDGLPYTSDAPWTGKLIVVEGTDGSRRTTQMNMLRDWLEVQGHGTVETGWTRSKLIGRAITEAKKGHTLSRMTHTLMYATDFADRLEYQILPALRNGFIVLADRYVYTAMSRAMVRGVDPEWLRELYGFAVVPDLVIHLKLPVPQLILRVIAAGQMNYWESGMDLNLGEDLYDSFEKYQTMIVDELDRMATAYDFITVDATMSPDAIQAIIRQHVTVLLKGRTS